MYRGADISLARPGRKQANVCQNGVNFLRRLAVQEKKTLWQLASRFCWNRAHPLHASALVSFLVGLRNYQHPVCIRRDGSSGKWLCFHAQIKMSSYDTALGEPNRSSKFVQAVCLPTGIRKCPVWISCETPTSLPIFLVVSLSSPIQIPGYLKLYRISFLPHPS